MKKTIFLFAAGAMLLTACTSSDVVEEAKQSNSVIDFATHVNKSTRAMTTDNIAYFKVYGSYKMSNNSRVINFNDVDVTKSEGKWGYNDLRYWIKDAKYIFYAYSNDGAALQSDDSNAETYEGTANFGPDGYLNIRNYKIDKQKDLVFAKSNEITGKDSGNAEVAFSFKHALARIRASFISGFPAGYEVTISALKFGGMNATGDYTTTAIGVDNEWSLPNGVNKTVLSVTIPDEQKIAKAKDGENQPINAESDYVYVIPRDYAGVKDVYIEFKISVKNENGDVVLPERVLKANWAPVWKQNNSYNYKVTINGSSAGLEAIKFTVTNVADWETGTPATGSFDLGATFAES